MISSLYSILTLVIVQPLRLQRNIITSEQLKWIILTKLKSNKHLEVHPVWMKPLYFLSS